MRPLPRSPDVISSIQEEAYPKFQHQAKVQMINLPVKYLNTEYLNRRSRLENGS